MERLCVYTIQTQQSSDLHVENSRPIQCKRRMAYTELTDNEIDDLDRFFSEDGVCSSAAGCLRYVGERGCVVEQLGQVRRGRVDAPPGRCL